MGMRTRPTCHGSPDYKTLKTEPRPGYSGHSITKAICSACGRGPFVVIPYYGFQAGVSANQLHFSSPHMEARQ